MRCLNLRAATLHYITWHLHNVTDYLRTPVRATGGGWCDALGTESTCRVTRRKKKKGVERFLGQEGNHSDTNNTLPLISLISSFLWLKVYYLGKSAAVVFSWKQTLPRWVVMLHAWEALSYDQGYRTRSSTYTYFCPLIIRIRLGYHLHLGTQKATERERKH